VILYLEITTAAMEAIVEAVPSAANVIRPMGRGRYSLPTKPEVYANLVNRACSDEVEDISNYLVKIIKERGGYGY